MMRIGIVADTHLKAGKQLPNALIEGLAGVDRILHAGDWVSLDAASQLEAIAPVDGVAGNNDGEDIVRRFGRRKFITLGRHKIGLVHGDGTRLTTERRAFEQFREERPDLIVFGHSHIPLDIEMDGIRLFNPGSPTAKRRQPKYSFGILRIDGANLEAEHHFFDDKSD